MWWLVMLGKNVCAPILNVSVSPACLSHYRVGKEGEQ